MRQRVAGMPPHMMDDAMENTMQTQMKAMCDAGAAER
jgi:hypothetical protein